LRKIQSTQKIEPAAPARTAGQLPGPPAILPVLWHHVGEEHEMPAILALLSEGGVPESSLKGAREICALCGAAAADPETLSGALTVRFVLDSLTSEESGIERVEVLPVWKGSVRGGVAALEAAKLLQFPDKGAIFAAGTLRHFGEALGKDWELPKCILEPLLHYRHPMGAGSYFLATAAVHLGDLASAVTGNEDLLSRIDPKILDLSGFNGEHYSTLKRVLSVRGRDIDALQNLL